MPSKLQAKMFRDFAEKDVFETAKQNSYEYMDLVFERRVYPRPDDIERLLEFAEDLPEQIGDAAAIVRELHTIGSPATVASIGGRYFGLVTGGAMPVALGARWLADVWDQNPVLYKSSPVAARLESICECWLKKIFGLPDETVAGFVSGSSSAILCGLAAARYRLLQEKGWDINRRGLRDAPTIRVVTGRHVHSTVIKAVSMLGLGSDNIEWVDVDDQGRIISEKVPKLDGQTILILQAGNVNSGSFDAFETLCACAREAGAWVHIDGAFGLWAAASGTLSKLTLGIGAAHSWSVDGHKTLNTPYDCGIVLCRDRAALVAALQSSGSYIAYGEERDGMLYTSEMSRRARAIEIWASLKYLGRQGIEELVDELHVCSIQMSLALKAENFEVLNDVVFNQILVACESDRITERTIHHIQESGECWVGGSRWLNRAVIRISICSWATTREDVSRSVRAFVEARHHARRESHGI